MIDDNIPLTIEGGELTTLQTCFTTEAEDYDAGSATNVSDSEASGGEAEIISSTEGSYLQWDFTPDYVVENGNIEVLVRATDPDVGDSDPEYSLFLDGTLLAEDFVLVPEDQYEWLSIDNSHEDWSFNGDLEAGQTHTLRIETTAPPPDPDATANAMQFDVVAPSDSRFEYDTPLFVDTDGYLDGPQLYPELLEVALEKVTARREITEARVASTWDDVSNNQYIALSNDGTNFIQTNNSDSATAEFAEPSTSVFVKFGLSRYPVDTDPQNATPRFGYNGQSIDSYDLFANPDSILPSGIGTYDVRSVIPANQVDATLREGGLLSADDTLLSRSIYSGLDLDNRQLISNERGRFDSR